jgi:hypothetical protein
LSTLTSSSTHFFGLPVTLGWTMLSILAGIQAAV